MRTVLLDEVTGFTEAVLGTETDDEQVIDMITSELLDIGGFPIAGGSMRRVHPEQDGLVLRDEIAEVDLAPGGDVVDDDAGEHVRLDLGRRNHVGSDEVDESGTGGRLGRRGRCGVIDLAGIRLGGHHRSAGFGGIGAGRVGATARSEDQRPGNGRCHKRTSRAARQETETEGATHHHILADAGIGRNRMIAVPRTFRSAAPLATTGQVGERSARRRLRSFGAGSPSDQESAVITRS